MTPSANPFAEVQQILGEALTSRGVRQWWLAPNRLLAGQAPLEAIRLGDAAGVLAAAHALAEGSYV